MAIRGQKPKPIEEHKRTGTYRADRHGTALAVVEALEPLPYEATPAEVFAQVMAEGVVWLGRTDAPALAMLASMLGEREDLRTAAISGLEGARRHLRELDKQIIGLMGNLGFDPASRSRLGLAEVKTKSKLAELQERQARR